MYLKERIKLGSNYFLAILLNRRKPIFIGWELTRQCNLKCKYCNVWDKIIPELNTEEILKLITILFNKGTRIIRFTGGEPLMRSDISKIIGHCKDLGIVTTIATNGILLPIRIDEIKRVDRIIISIDGPEEIHDMIRGNGSYQKALRACEVAKSKSIPISIATTLTSLNLNCIKHLLVLANKFKTKVSFQPVTTTILFGVSPNPLCPSLDEYRKSIIGLMKIKRNSKVIVNSLEGLKYLLHWPNKKAINCVAGKVFFRLDSEGKMYACPRAEIRNPGFNVLEKGIIHCLKYLSSPHCDYCYSSALIEMNLITNFNPCTLINNIAI